MINCADKIAAVFGLIIACFCCMVLAGEAELVWVEPGEEYQIMLSRWNGEMWAESMPVYQSKNPLTSVALVTDLDGVKVMVWSERFRTSVVLMKMQRAAGASQWSKAALFSDFGKENMAATMVVDRLNQIWLFWAANHGDLDDIYLVKRSKQGWSVPVQVNSKNEVPDVRPNAELDLQGNVLVSWQSYSLVARKYLASKRVFRLDKSSENIYKSDSGDVDEISLNNVSLPDFFPEHAVALIHFPNNRLQQSARVVPNQQR